MIDWSYVVNRLRSSRGSLEKVARQVDSCPQHLRRLARGDIQDTKFMVGVKLLDMHIDDYPDDHKKMAL